jgi:hypothetical protein
LLIEQSQQISNACGCDGIWNLFSGLTHAESILNKLEFTAGFLSGNSSVGQAGPTLQNVFHLGEHKRGHYYEEVSQMGEFLIAPEFLCEDRSQQLKIMGKVTLDDENYAK